MSNMKWTSIVLRDGVVAYYAHSTHTLGASTHIVVDDGGPTADWTRIPHLLSEAAVADCVSMWYNGDEDGEGDDGETTVCDNIANAFSAATTWDVEEQFLAGTGR